ncbi:GNAT family N-acetyltransferase [Belliella sp. DSM 111904]|uniref:GNAT family N-acetyltransferase n=1 Tax=Belliella filtrata TaxID=2923435 RepID=A0ABS9UXD2_9BACT|nr:GNAT family N-acetyltransferase [Belliella filtrata]MCH7408594.1 GNAT family N-acetyltransferase [Belliella filtrata]
MIFREAQERDIPQIVALLKSSLGEGLIPKSAALWKWKHEQNPFGKSLVLVAEFEGRLIGVRAFLRWTWLEDSKRIEALRAVDTAVLPEMQGLGVFSKLTKQLASKAEEDGFHFIFNTPNKKSLPGYLKLGWRNIGRVNLAIQWNHFFPTKTQKSTAISDEKWEKLKYIDFSNSKVGVRTLYSFAYIMWRYANNPLFRYELITDEKNYVLIYRFKASKRLREMRIVEFLVFGDEGTIDKALLKKKLKQIQKSVHFTSCSLTLDALDIRKLGNFFRIPFGPKLTLKPLNFDQNQLSKLKDQWKYSIGDFELF